MNSIAISRPPHIAMRAVAEWSGEANKFGIPICTSATSPSVAANDIWKAGCGSAISQQSQSLTQTSNPFPGRFPGLSHLGETFDGFGNIFVENMSVAQRALNVAMVH